MSAKLYEMLGTPDDPNELYKRRPAMLEKLVALQRAKKK